MRKMIITTALFVSFTVSAQKGKEFPNTPGVTLESKPIKLPIENGKISIIAVAFSRGAEDELKKWLNPLYSMFMLKSKGTKGMNMTTNYDVNFVFVPMIAGIKMVFEEFKSSTDKAFWPYVMDTQKSDMKSVAVILDVNDRKIPYIFVLDKEGKVLDFQTGEYSDDKIEAMEEAIE